MIASTMQARGMAFCLIVLFLIFGSCSPSLAQPDLSGKKVLFLHSLEANVPLFVETDRGLSTMLESGGLSSINQFFESLDLRRNPGPEQRKLLVEEMRVRYRHRKLDMLITMYPEALEFVLKDCRHIFPDVPILALYLPQGFEPPKTDRHIIGHSASVDIIGTLVIALKLVPGAKRVYVISGAHEVDRKYEDQARRDLKKWETMLEFHYLSRMSFEDMVATISTAPPDSIVLHLTLTQDVTGRSYNTPTVVQRLSQVSTAPIFGILKVALGHGIAGGSLMNFERIGTKAGELSLGILGGTKPPENIPAVLDVPPVPMFDWRQLRHWNLNEDALPRGSIVMNKESTLWDHRYYVLGFLAFCILEAVLIVVLIVQRRRKDIAEALLRQKTEELGQFFNVSLDLLGIANQKGYFQRLNPATESILGYTREELMSRPFLDFVHPDDQENTRGAVSTLASQEKVFSFENRYRCKDGTYRWLQWSSAPVGDRIYAAARDVTESKLIGKALAESQAQVLALFDGTNDLIWSVDPETFGLVTFNRALKDYFFKRLGIDIRVGMTPDELLSPKHAVEWREFYKRALRDGSYVTEYPIVAGTILLSINPLRREGNVFGISVFGKDITERKRAEDAIRESEAKYHSLYEGIMDGFVLTGMDGKILTFNDPYREMTGYSSDELLNLNYRDMTPEKWHDSQPGIIEQQVLTREYSEVYEKEYRRKDGTVFPVELRTFLLKDDKGDNLGVWAIVRDITSRKQIESEARKLKDDLAHVTRVSTLGGLTTSLAHEINQPLAAILSNAQAAQRFLAQDNPDMQEIREILGDIIRDDNRAAEVIRKIRSLLKREATLYESLSLNEVIEEILNVIRNDTALAAVSIEKEFDPSLPVIWGDRIQLQQVILNLVLNAAEAMREAGPDLHRLIVRTSRHDDCFAEVSVRDFGPGIQKDSMSRLFDPFYTTKSGGMGMGLAISKDIVMSHRGELRAENNPDRGATFSFTVPFDKGEKS